MDKFCLYAILGLTILVGVVVLAFLDYKGKINKKAVVLEKNDHKQTETDQEHQQRINKLEEKNGAEQRQIDSQGEEIKQLKKQVAELLKNK